MQLVGNVSHRDACMSSSKNIELLTTHTKSELAVLEIVKKLVEVVIDLCRQDFIK
jgi:hypothetical protein